MMDMLIITINPPLRVLKTITKSHSKTLDKLSSLRVRM
jgi:hypothetical protein